MGPPARERGWALIVDVACRDEVEATLAELGPASAPVPGRHPPRGDLQARVRRPAVLPERQRDHPPHGGARARPAAPLPGPSLPPPGPLWWRPHRPRRRAPVPPLASRGDPRRGGRAPHPLRPGRRRRAPGCPRPCVEREARRRGDPALQLQRHARRAPRGARARPRRPRRPRSLQSRALPARGHLCRAHGVPVLAATARSWSSTTGGVALPERLRDRRRHLTRYWVG